MQGDDIGQFGIFAHWEQLLATDPGQRGIASLVQPGDLLAACATLRTCQEVTIVTGFYIPAAGACETDGPPGALSLGRALQHLGKQVDYLTDAACWPVLHPYLGDSLVVYPHPSAQASPNPPEHPAPTGKEGVSRRVWIAVERVGRAADGRYYNMRARDLTAWTAPLDDYFLLAQRTGCPTMGIGDGGNEIGMGRCSAQIVQAVKFGETIACVVPTDSLIVAGVSNWGAWGLLAGLERFFGQRLLPTEDQAWRDLVELVAWGAVDGVTGQRTPTVDGLEWPVHARMLADLARLPPAR